MKFNKIIALLMGVLLVSTAIAGDSEKEKEFRVAAGIGDVETLERLLDEGIPVDTANRFGVTALMMAIQNDNLEATALLLARGADVNAEASEGCTALTFAAENGHDALIGSAVGAGCRSQRQDPRRMGCDDDRRTLRSHRHGRAVAL